MAREKETVAAVAERKYGPQKDKSVWNVTFVGGKVASTFSSTFAEAFKAAEGKEVEVEVVPALDGEGKQREFSGVLQWNVEDLWVDGKQVEHTTPSKRGGGGFKANPEWSFRTPEERASERRSIESQKSLDKAGAIVHAAVQMATDATTAGAFRDDKKAFDPELALQWVEGATERLAKAAAKAVPVYAKAIRDVVDGAGSGSQTRSPSRAQGSGRSSGSGAPASQAGAGGVPDATDEAPASSAGARRSPPGQSTRPGPAPSSTSGFSPERWEALVESWGGQKKDLGAVYRAQFSKSPTISAITEEELSYLEALAAGMSTEELAVFVKESHEQLAKQEGAVA